jgi:glyoxylase-like metal-dependent hydrolase (beta-lactamase superfamily II)
MEEFEEVAERVWVARHAWLDVNVTAVLGERGWLLVDTLGSTTAATAMLTRLRRISSAPLVAAINTHAHFDHVLGNAAVRADSPDVTLLAHEDAVLEMPASLERVAADPAAHGVAGARREEVLASRLLLPELTLSSVRTLDLGDRHVEVVHCGRGHTAGDVVVRVPEADVLATGDLVEQGAPPSYGDDCWPLAWPESLDMAGQMTTATTTVVPGHGAVVDQRFLHEQRRDLGVVAETIYELARQGVGVAEASAHDEWPFPRESLGHAVRRGYEHLPPAARRLPLA